LGFIYCLYSTQDGQPRFVGHTADRASHSFKQHITAALDKEPGLLNEWIRDTWRAGFDVGMYVLQEEVAPTDLPMFQQYWSDHFRRILDQAVGDPKRVDSPVAKQIVAAIKAQLACDELESRA
jgi:hypothetical protein